MGYYLARCQKCNEEFESLGELDCITCRVLESFSGNTVVSNSVNNISPNKTDLQIAEDFFNMLKRNGVTIKEFIEPNGGKCFTIMDHCWENVEATEFSFFEDGEYWRIDGAVYGPNLGGYNKNKIHVRGWNRDKKD